MDETILSDDEEVDVDVTAEQADVLEKIFDIEVIPRQKGKPMKKSAIAIENEKRELELIKQIKATKKIPHDAHFVVMEIIVAYEAEAWFGKLTQTEMETIIPLYQKLHDEDERLYGREKKWGVPSGFQPPRRS